MNPDVMAEGIATIFEAMIKYDKGKIVEKRLEKVRNLLNIYFAPIYGGFEFCVQHAKSNDHARCYMRCHALEAEDEVVNWIDWCRGHRAVEFAKLVDGIRDKQETLERRIFHNTPDTRFLKAKGRYYTDGGEKLKDKIQKAILDTLGNEFASSNKKGGL